MNLINCASVEETDEICYITKSTQDCFTWIDNSQCMKYIHIYVRGIFLENREKLYALLHIHIDYDSIGLHAHGELEAFEDAWRMYSIFMFQRISITSWFNMRKIPPLNQAGVVSEKQNKNRAQIIMQNG